MRSSRRLLGTSIQPSMVQIPLQETNLDRYKSKPFPAIKFEPTNNLTLEESFSKAKTIWEPAFPHQMSSQCSQNLFPPGKGKAMSQKSVIYRSDPEQGGLLLFL